MNFVKYLAVFIFLINLNLIYTLNSLLTSTNSLDLVENVLEINDDNIITTLPAKTTTNLLPNSLDPFWYLNKFGYLDNKNLNKANTKKSANLMMLPNTNGSSNAAIEAAIKKFQKHANLNQTGMLDQATLKMMKVPRCGHPDIQEDMGNNLFRKRRYALQGSKWPKSKLRFKISKYPKYGIMTKEQIDKELKRAFDLWSEASDVEFEQVTDPYKNFMSLLLMSESDAAAKATDNADIDVRFETGFHGDSEPFDGSGLILGHAYFPEFGGSTHFDADEYWTMKQTDGVNLYQVAVHEFGHALGLEHSDNFDAIMAPFFRGYTEDFKLNSDDLTAIEMLYGKSKRNSNKVKNKLIPNSRNNMPNVYQNEFNNFDFYKPTFEPKTTTTYQTKVTERKKFLVTKIIKQTFTHRMPNVYNQQPEFFEHNTLSLCRDGKFDAITVLSDGFTYIFKDAYVFKIDSNFVMERGYPKLINSVFKGWNGLTYMNLPSNLDTVLYVPDNGMTYFFKNNLYWRSSKLYELDTGYPRLISENFKGLNSENGFNGKLDASFVWSGNRRIYFVENNRYWRYDFDLRAIEPGYPKRLSIWRGLPPKITDAFLWVNGITYFFDEDKYYRFNDLAFKVEEDAWPRYPRLSKDYWFGCNPFNKFGKLIFSTKLTKFTSNIPELYQENIDFERIEKGVNISFINPTTSRILSENALIIDENNGLNQNNLNQTEDSNKDQNLLNLKSISDKTINVSVILSHNFLVYFNLIFLCNLFLYEFFIY